MESVALEEQTDSNHSLLAPPSLPGFFFFRSLLGTIYFSSYGTRPVKLSALRRYDTLGG